MEIKQLVLHFPIQRRNAFTPECEKFFAINFLEKGWRQILFFLTLERGIGCSKEF